MTDLRKAAEMALEALMQKGEHHPKVYQAAEALRQALAQPEQEPEKVMAKYEFQTYAAYKVDGEMKIGVVPEHTAWVTAGEHTVPLEVSAPVDAVNMNQERVDKTVKNRHEPVAWMKPSGLICPYKHGSYTIPLYTAPPKREWVDPTNDEIYQILNMKTGDAMEIAKALLAKAKEKNYE